MVAQIFLAVAQTVNNALVVVTADVVVDKQFGESRIVTAKVRLSVTDKLMPPTGGSSFVLEGAATHVN